MPVRVATVLPPRESFSPDAAGAIGLLVHRLAAARGGQFQTVVVGSPVAAPFGGVDFRPAPTSWRLAKLAGRYAAGVRRVLRELRPSLIEVHNRPEVALALVRLGVPVTLFLHNDPQGMRGFRTPAARARAAASLASIVAVSGWLRHRTGLNGVLVLPNCIDLATLPPAPQRRELVILFAGRIVADKGAGAFVAACARALPMLPGWRAAMIGADRFGADSPDTPFLRTLRPAAAAAGVTMQGWQPHASVLEAMARAAIVAVPSRWPEPFGMTALEAMASGAAVLFAPRGGLPEVVGKAGVKIDPDDPAGFAQHLIALARDPERLAQLGRVAQERARRFDLQPAAARLDALRSDILAAWPGHSGGTI